MSPSSSGPRPSIVSPSAERQLLQFVIAVAGFVPVGFGLEGAILGGGLAEESTGVVIDSQMRFLSGLLVGIGLAYWEAIPQIEVRASRLRLLTAIVTLGGLVRLIGLLVATANATTLLCLLMELGVAPLVCLWQARIARRFGIGSHLPSTRRQ